MSLSPAVATAQRGRGTGGGGFGKARSGLTGGEPLIDVPKQVNAVNLLIEHRQELALSDSQFVHVVTVKRSLDSADAPLLRRVDSVARLFKSQSFFQQPSPERRDSIATGKALVRETMATVEANLSDARERAFALLSSPQRDKADDLAAAAQKAIDEEKAAQAERGRGGPPSD